MRGDMAAALSELRAQYDTGADPAVVLTDLAEFTHFVTRVKIVPAVADDQALVEVERARGRGFAEKLSMRVLSRTWQMLLKGIGEVEPPQVIRLQLPRWCWCASPMLPIFRRPTSCSGRSTTRGRVPACRPLGRTGRIRPHPLPSGSRPRRSGAVPRAPPLLRRCLRAIRSGRPQAEPSAAALLLSRFEDLIALASPESGPRSQARARARREAGSLRRGAARDPAGAERRQDPGQRSRA